MHGLGGTGAEDQQERQSEESSQGKDSASSAPPGMGICPHAELWGQGRGRPSVTPEGDCLETGEGFLEACALLSRLRVPVTQGLSKSSSEESDSWKWQSL